MTPATESEVEEIITKLNPMKSSGLDFQIHQFSYHQ